MNDKKLVSLDIFEMGYLLDACIRGSHLRSDTIRRFVDDWYDLYTEDERMRLFEWTIRLTYDQRWTSNGKDYKPHFEPCTTCCGHDVEFVHRYHPNNQYQVTTLYEGKKEQHRCFLMNGQYYLTSNQLIAKEYIVSVEHISCPKWEKRKQPGVDYDKNIMSTVPNARILRDDERL